MVSFSFIYLFLHGIRFYFVGLKQPGSDFWSDQHFQDKTVISLALRFPLSLIVLPQCRRGSSHVRFWFVLAPAEEDFDLAFDTLKLVDFAWLRGEFCGQGGKKSPTCSANQILKKKKSCDEIIKGLQKAGALLLVYG